MCVYSCVYVYMCMHAYTRLYYAQVFMYVYVVCVHICMYIYSDSRRKYEENELDCRKMGGLTCYAFLELYHRKKGWSVKKRCPSLLAFLFTSEPLSSYPNSLCIFPCLVTWPGRSLDYCLVSIILYWSYSIFKREIVIFLNS